MTIIEALQQINYGADRAHNRHSTPGFGQMMVYNEKTEQATDYLAAKCPNNLTGYPLIEVEVEATNKTGKDVANEIIKRRGEWLSMSSKIEGIRLRGKTKIYNNNINLEETVDKIIKELDKI